MGAEDEPGFERRGDGVRFRVWVQPRASRTGIVGTRQGALHIRIAAPPVEGEANDALIRFLAKKLKVPRSAITIAAGARGRSKAVDVAGLDPDTAARRLA